MTAALHTDADPGLWCQRFGSDANPAGRNRAALFLDRDGVLVEEVNYLHKAADMRIIPGAPAAVRVANDRGLAVIVVTNQSGVGRGYYGWAEFAALQAALVEIFAEQGARFDMVLACAYHANAQAPFDRPDHPWRKPQPGMLEAAADALALDLSRSWIVGDAASDIEAGRNAGLAGAVHVATGHGIHDRDAALAIATRAYRVRTAASLSEAAPIVTSHSG